jgi:hypothetical protein
MTNKSNNNTNGHVNPFYLEIEEEHDDDELSDYEDGVEQAGLLRPTPASVAARSRNNTGPRKQWRRLCLLLVVILALFALKWNRKITPGGSKGEKLPTNDDDDNDNNKNDDDDSDDDKVPVIEDDTQQPNPSNNNQGNKPTNDTPNASVDPHSCFQTGDSPIRINTDDGSLRYACPCSFNDAEQPPTHSMFPDHSTQIISNMTRFMKTFRHMELDDWGHSYAEVKKGMHDWITRQYTPHLTDNNLIYESALGEGLHLHMVLDILKEVKQIHNITVYGNDRSSGSVQAATALGKQKYLPAGGKLGTICQADSTQLSFVPSESFDLVFAAYIRPLSDPLEWHPTGDPLNAYVTLCKKAENGDEEAMKQKRDAQHRQDRWFAQWFAEMVRVAKKGAPIIVEHVSYP